MNIYLHLWIGCHFDVDQATLSQLLPRMFEKKTINKTCNDQLLNTMSLVKWLCMDLRTNWNDIFKLERLRVMNDVPSLPVFIQHDFWRIAYA